MAAVIVLAFVRIVFQADSSLGASMALRVLVPTVEVAHGSAGFRTADDGEVLVEGDRARTDRAGRALINFFDGSSLSLDPDTEITVLGVDERSSGVIATFAQGIGRTWSSVNKQGPNARYEIRTPAATAVVRGTGFEIEVLADGTTTIRVLDGTVTASAQGATTVVGAGFQTAVVQGQAPQAPRPLDLARLRVVLRSSELPGAFVTLLDPFNRSCGALDPAALAVSGPTVVELRQPPLCAASAPEAGIATAEIARPPAGPYTIVILPAQRDTNFTLEVSGVLGATLTFTLGVGGDIIGNEIQVARLPLAIAPNGAPTTTGLVPLTRVRYESIDAAAPLPPGALGKITLGQAPPVALLPLEAGAPLPPRPIYVAPVGAGASLSAILATGGLLLGGIFMFRDLLKPVYVAASVAAVTAFIASMLTLLVFYRDLVTAIFYTMGRLLR